MTKLANFQFQPNSPVWDRFIEKYYGFLSTSDFSDIEIERFLQQEGLYALKFMILEIGIIKDVQISYYKPRLITAQGREGLYLNRRGCLSDKLGDAGTDELFEQTKYLPVIDWGPTTSIIGGFCTVNFSDGLEPLFAKDPGSFNTETVGDMIFAGFENLAILPDEWQARTKKIHEVDGSTEIFKQTQMFLAKRVDEGGRIKQAIQIIGNNLSWRASIARENLYELLKEFFSYLGELEMLCELTHEQRSYVLSMARERFESFEELQQLRNENKLLQTENDLWRRWGSKIPHYNE